jgi:hypothetical protein
MADGGTTTSVKVLDTYLRGLKKLVGLAADIDELEREVASREAVALRDLLAEVQPLLPHLTRPVSIREPWLVGRETSGGTWREKGVVLVQSFQQDRSDEGRISHNGSLLVLTESGRLVELVLEGAWTEQRGGGAIDARWRVDAQERPIEPEFARAHLRPILTGLLDALKEALVRGRADREELRRRLAILDEVDSLLRRGDEA